MNEIKGNAKHENRGRTFDDAYKRQAVELTMSPGRTVLSVAEELGLTRWTLYRWRAQYAAGFHGDGPGRPRPSTLEEAEAENRRLRAEVLRLREREIVLKKSLGILSETPVSGMPRSTQ